LGDWVIVTRWGGYVAGKRVFAGNADGV